MKSTLRSGKVPACVFLAGVGLGWVIGLSLSPVVQGVITALLTVSIATTAVMAGLTVNPTGGVGGPSEPSPVGAGAASKRAPRRRKLDPVPVALLVVGVAVGTAIGIFVRANDVLSPSPAAFVARWRETGMSERELTGRYFDSLYPPASGEGKATNHAHAKSGLFTSVPPDERSRLCNMARDAPELLENALLNSQVDSLRDLAKMLSPLPPAQKQQALKSYLEKHVCSPSD